jgi:hypothetical protein
MMLPKVLSFVRGDLSRKTMLFVVLPLILISHYGVLGLAIWLYPEPYDWRYISISRLLYPRNNPTFYYVASISVVVSGVLMIPFAGYIRRRLRGASPVSGTVGAALYFVGCICLIPAGLIASHPAHGTSSLPKLHEMLARVSVIGIALGILVFNACATRAYFHRADGNAPHRRSLIVSWNLFTLPALLITLAWLVIRVLLKRGPTRHAIATSPFWHLGFWEWIGSVAIIGFLMCAVLFLPERGTD